MHKTDLRPDCVWSAQCGRPRSAGIRYSRGYEEPYQAGQASSHVNVCGHCSIRVISASCKRSGTASHSECGNWSKAK